MKTRVSCDRCGGCGWVCVDHPQIGWNGGDGCCEADAMACVCNPEEIPLWFTEAVQAEAKGQRRARK